MSPPFYLVSTPASVRQQQRNKFRLLFFFLTIHKVIHAEDLHFDALLNKAVQWICFSASLSLSLQVPALGKQTTRGQYLTCSPVPFFHWFQWWAPVLYTISVLCEFPYQPYVCWRIVGIHPRQCFRQTGMWMLGLRIIRSTHTCRIKWGKWFFLGTGCSYSSPTQPYYTAQQPIEILSLYNTMFCEGKKGYVIYSKSRFYHHIYYSLN